MGFNLATFLVQLINLFVLIWILKHFLYQPILMIIDKRRKEIENQIQQAEDKLISASNLEQDLFSQKKAFESEQQLRLDNLSKDISKQKAQMMKELELNYIAKRQKLQDELNSSWSLAEKSVKEMLTSEFMTLAQKVLAEWSDKTMLDQVLFLFRKKLMNLSSKQHLELQKILSQQKVVVIFTSEKINPKQKDFLKEIFSQFFTLPPKLRFQFKTKTELTLGIEVCLDNFLIDWNLETYLQEINEHLKNNISGLIVPSQRKEDK